MLNAGQKGTAHGAPALGRKNRKQRLVEYSKARAEVMRTAGALAELPNGAHMARGNGADAEADFAADEDVAQERVAAHTTIVFAGVDARLG
ncbi:hypothetical protein FA95DRAFT_1567102 [Auriscalpium vulgare]|uniref:Uncharacterized protein n=1 Tax=Auriscalpium vulgare TaxID=40419 RepID=A0ACB8R7K5_9AGAM|nr:hypothetical protein FA95DRAFT_1567102 [Auriscalpium vulgare]